MSAENLQNRIDQLVRENTGHALILDGSRRISGVFSGSRGIPGGPDCEANTMGFAEDYPFFVLPGLPTGVDSQMRMKVVVEVLTNADSIKAGTMKWDREVLEALVSFARCWEVYFSHAELEFQLAIRKQSNQSPGTTRPITEDVVYTEDGGRALVEDMMAMCARIDPEIEQRAHFHRQLLTGSLSEKPDEDCPKCRFGLRNAVVGLGTDGECPILRSNHVNVQFGPWWGKREVCRFRNWVYSELGGCKCGVNG